MSDKITEEYWSRFPETYDKKMEYVVGKELREWYPGDRDLYRSWNETLGEDQDGTSVC